MWNKGEVDYPKIETEFNLYHDRNNLEFINVNLGLSGYVRIYCILFLSKIPKKYLVHLIRSTNTNLEFLQ